MTKIKICGITNFRDAVKSLDCGADALGFIFYEKSKRYISPPEAQKIIKELPPFVTKVAVFVDCPFRQIIKITSELFINAIQLHGSETPEFCAKFSYPVIKALRIKDSIDILQVDSFATQTILFDTYSESDYGGTGKSFNWKVLEKLNTDKKIILSGGLNPGNIEKAITTVRPYGVDVSSGVETSPGIKDHKKIKKFIEAVKNAD
jgi:phosphoribosylanthranilate isomerase